MSNPGVTNPTAGVTNDDTVSDQTDTSDTTAAEDISDDDTDAENGTGDEVTDDNQDGDDDGEDSEGEGEDTRTDDAEPETIEIEEDGEKFKVPKKLEKALLRQKDYTQKTQAHAETVRAFEAEQQVARANIKELAQFHNINDQVTAYEQVDWDGLLAQDPETYHREWRRFQTLKDDGRKLIGTIQQNQKQALEKQRTEIAKRIEDSKAAVKTLIPSWSDDTDKKLVGYISKENISQEDMLSATLRNPKFAVMAHKARLYDESQTKTATVKKIVQVQQTKPVPQARSGSSPTTPKDPSKMSTAQYVAWRKANP